MISGSFRNRVVAALMILAAGALLLAAGCAHRNKASEEPVRVATVGAFAGKEACVECHAAECNAHRGSRHDRTMHAATLADLGAMAPPTGIVPLAGYGVEERASSLAMVRQSFDTGKEELQPLQLALGSGKVGITFVALLKPDTMLEARMTYFPSYHLWDLTPGQEVKLTGDVPFGRTHTGETARRCVGCHATLVSSESLQPEPRFYGVGCESCHGSGQAHIEAMHAQRYSEPHMEKLGKLSSTELNQRCGKCHRNVEDVDLHSNDATLTHRFQPYALQRSACRTKSNEPLSCLSCHDPHTDVSTDTKKYEQACLNCHAKPGAQRPVSTDPNWRVSRPCPVNATQGCIACHMRSRRLFPATTITATLADHLISIEHK